ncbi:hypothetical protein PTTG_30969, partial [Puccinia triticina 1-1 BBBD Race 1]
FVLPTPSIARSARALKSAFQNFLHSQDYPDFGRDILMGIQFLVDRIRGGGVHEVAPRHVAGRERDGLPSGVWAGPGTCTGARPRMGGDPRGQSDGRGPGRRSRRGVRLWRKTCGTRRW